MNTPLSTDLVTQDMIDRVCAGMGNEAERDIVWRYITKLKDAIDTWRKKYEPRCAESCWQMDDCVAFAPQLVEDVMDIAGYHKDDDE